MSLIHEFNEERKARLVRLGARSCPTCMGLRNELANKTRASDAIAADQAAAIEGYKARIAAFEAAAALTATPNAIEPVVSDPIYRAANGGGIAITVINIVGAVCRHFGLSYAEIISQRRDIEVVLPRQIVMYLAKTLTTRSFPEIGRRIGDRDHTTILHGVRKIKALVESGHPIAEDIDAIRVRLGVA